MFKHSISHPQIDWPKRYQNCQQMCQHPLLRAFYANALPQDKTPLAEIEFLALDFETTGLNPLKDDIITIGMVPFTLNRIFIKRARHWTIRPRKQLNEESIVIHGVTHNDVLDAPDFSEVVPEVLASMSGHIMVVHYRRIEREFLNRELNARYQEGIAFPVIDTMALEEQIQEQQAGGLLNMIKGKKKQPVRLGSSRTRYGLPAYPPHHALTDAIATAELLQAQVAYHFDNKAPVSSFWL